MGYGSAGADGMWRRRDTVVVPRRPWLGTGAVVLAAVFSAGGGAARVAEPAVAPRLDLSHGLRAHRLVERWTQAGGVPGRRDASIRVAGAVAVKVTLRLDGTTMGRGVAPRADLASQLDEPGGTGPVDLLDLIEPATAAALEAALQEAQRRGLDEVILAEAEENAVTERRARRLRASDLGPSLSVDLQIAHDPARIVLGDRDADDLFYARFAPGYHGLMTRPAGVEPGATLVWPGTAVAGNLSPQRQVVRLLNRSEMPIDGLAQLARADGVPAYRFEAMHLVRPRPELPVMRLIRGGELLPGRFVDRQTLGGMADRLALHLFGRFTGDGRLRGSYRPARAEYRPEWADDREAMLACYVLLRYAAEKARQANPERFFEGVADAARRGIEARLAGRAESSATPPDPVADAFALLGVLEAPPGAFGDAARDAMAAALRDAVDDEGRVSTIDGGSATQAAGTAAVLAALARHAELTRDPDSDAAVARMLTTFWTVDGGRLHVNSLPWLALAHDAAAARLVADGRLDPAVTATARTKFRQSLELIAQRQVVERPSLGPADVLGGIDLAAVTEGGPPAPNWQTAALLSFLATAARQEAVVPPDERHGVLLTASGAARFVAQLMMDQPHCFAVRSPDEAVGGVKVSPWNNRLDVMPSAVALLAMIEMEATQRALAGG
ncbi:MAG: hypothetical protein AAF710_04335 [Planctomycetota bacterium]